MSARHKYPADALLYGHRSATCERCGIERVRRHAGFVHWTEWWRDGKYVSSGLAPDCAPAATLSRVSAPPQTETP